MIILVLILIYTNANTNTDTDTNTNANANTTGARLRDDPRAPGGEQSSPQKGLPCPPAPVSSDACYNLY